MSAPDIALLSEETWQFVYGAMRNGLGLSATCAGLHLDVQAMSVFLRKSPGILAEIQRQIASGFKANVGKLMTAQTKGKPGEWAGTRRILSQDFIVTLTLWEDFCVAADVTPDLLAAAYELHRAPQEVATAVGFTRRDLLLYVRADVNLHLYLTQQGFAAA